MEKWSSFWRILPSEHFRERYLYSAQQYDAGWYIDRLGHENVDKWWGFSTTEKRTIQSPSVKNCIDKYANISETCFDFFGGPAAVRSRRSINIDPIDSPIFEWCRGDQYEAYECLWSIIDSLVGSLDAREVGKSENSPGSQISLTPSTFSSIARQPLDGNQ